MRKIVSFLLLLILISCVSHRGDTGEKIITVSIAPFKYFVKEIAGDDFKVNVMVPAGADAHIYEPYPEQINQLRRSIAYISNGYLGFEATWLNRFYETNPSMKRLSLGDKINLMVTPDGRESNHLEGADPHYWVSPKCAMIMASSIKDLLTGINPLHEAMYKKNCENLIVKIQEVDNEAASLFSNVQRRSFMIYHPNLAYFARDYNLEEISVEYEGKEPSPSRLKELIDRASIGNLKVIFIQKEYDTKNAKAIASEIGAKVIIIDPLSEDWENSTTDIIMAVYKSLIESSK